jgi:ABC-type antimicrobial peptide transport system permease subunit
MRELFKCALWALVISLPISLLGAAVSMGLAHSTGLVFILTNILFAPVLLFSVIVDTYFKESINNTSFNVLALLFQFLGYFLAVVIVRILYRRIWQKKT